jgi:hypothetical protein
MRIAYKFDIQLYLLHRGGGTLKQEIRAAADFFDDVRL